MSHATLILQVLIRQKKSAHQLMVELNLTPSDVYGALVHLDAQDLVHFHTTLGKWAAA